MAFAAQVTILSLGSGVGFTSFDPELGDQLGRGTLIAAGSFTIAASLLSLFLGGFIASRMAGYKIRSISALHGICCWAVVSFATIILVGMGIGNAMGAGLSLIGAGVRGVAVGGARALSATDLDLNLAFIRREVRSLLEDSGKAQLSPTYLSRQAENLPTKAAKAQAMPGGKNGSDVLSEEAGEITSAMDEEAVANIISKRMNISRDEALALIGQSEERANAVLSSVTAKVSELGMRTAEASTNAAAATSWITFFTLIFGAAAAFFGGLIGGPLGLGPLTQKNNGYGDSVDSIVLRPKHET